MAKAKAKAKAKAGAKAKGAAIKGKAAPSQPSRRVRTASAQDASGALAAALARVAELEARLDGGEGRPSAAEERRLAEQAESLAAANNELRNLNRNLDQIVRQRTRALAESESQLRRQNVELDRLNRMKTEFISIAAHELRTPLTSIVGYLELIIEGRFGEPAPALARPLASVRRNAHRLRRLVEDMLDASRIETGRLSLSREACRLETIVQDVVDEMRPLADRKQQRIETDLAAVPAVDADADKLHQIVGNLVANSVKYTPEGGQIRLSVDIVQDGAEGERRARLRVWDNGIGVPAALRSRVFEPFSDINSARHHTSDTPDSAGLGLYIARRLVELHSGRIDVESEEGRFTEFTVLLPLA